MFKKHLPITLVLAAVILLAAAMSLAACQGNQSATCNHSFGESISNRLSPPARTMDTPMAAIAPLAA